MIYRRFAKIFFLIILVFLGGTLGYRIIEGWPLTDSFYMTIITISTVGYGEVASLSETGRIFTIILIITGIAVITTSVRFIFSSIMEGTFSEVMRRQRMEKKLTKIKNHFIICGFGAVGEDVLSEFLHAKVPFVVIERQKDVMEALLNRFPQTIYVTGDATDDEVLKTARIEEAKGLIAVLGKDADNLYICLTARSLNSKLRIIARAIESEAINKLKKAGADYVFSPEKIGGMHLAAAALKPSVTSFLDAIVRGEHFNLLLDEMEVEKNSIIAEKTLKDSEISKNIGIIIPAIKSGTTEKLTFNPSSNTTIYPGDILIAFGTIPQIKQLKKICKSSGKII